MKSSSTLREFRRKTSFAITSALTALLVPILTSPVAMASAGSNGDPFSNGSFFPDTGTFQATIRGKNLSGVTVFSTSSEGPGNGQFTVFANGNTYIGNTNAAINGHNVAATLEASIPQSGEGEISSVINSQFGLIAREVTYGGTETTTNTSSTSTTTPDQVTTVAGGTTTTTNTNSTTTPDQVTTVGGVTTTEQTSGSTNTETQTVQRDGDILVFEIAGTPGSGGNPGTPGGVIIVSTDQAVTLQPGSPPAQAALNPSLPGLGSTTISTTTTVQGPTESTSTTSDQVTTVSGGTTTSTDTSSVTTPDQVTTVSGGTTTTTQTDTSETVTPDQVTETYGLINTVATSTFNDVLYASGSFNAKLYNSYPNQQFNGKGTMTFQEVDASSGIPELVSTTVSIVIDGIRTSDDVEIYNPIQIETPYVLTTYAIETGAGT